ncbi:MAG: hypothetical protein ACRDE2_03695 [Chitinophagaceae bacterium]
MKKLMNRLMLSCKKASALIIKREDFRLTRMEKIKLFFHLLLCDACHAFAKQNELIGKALEQDTNPTGYQTEEMQVPEGLKERILSKIA